MAANGETPEQAALRLFSEAYAQELSVVQSPRLLQGARPGRPVPISADYRWDAQLVRWVLPDEAKAVSGNLFAAMWPSAMEKDGFLVPMVKNGRTVCQFYVDLQGGRWVGRPISESSLPTGEVYWLEVATAKLKALLGRGTLVRPVIFLPSGNAFAVGDNNGREAAAYLGYSNLGRGVGDVDITNFTHRYGELFTPAQLRALFTR